LTEYSTIIYMVLEECNRARDRFPPFRSFHEGYAITKEELDELWTEIKSHDKHPLWNQNNIRKEAIHLAAMSIRFLLDFTTMLEASVKSTDDYLKRNNPK
jgi:hypothetical protein